MSNIAAVTGLLNWHVARRQQGIATVSVLVGPIGVGVREWHRWAGRTDTRVTPVSSANPVEIACLWVTAVFAQAKPNQLVRHWLRARLPNHFNALPIDRGQFTRHDIKELWRSMSIDEYDSAVAVAYEILIAIADGRQVDTTRFVRELIHSETGAIDSMSRVLAGVYELSPGTRWPALVFAQPDDAEGDSWFRCLLPVLEAIACAVPRLAVGICVPQAVYDAVITEAGHTRAMTLVREGRITLDTVSDAELREQLRIAGVIPPPPDATLARLTAIGLAPDVASAFVEAAQAI